MASEVLTDIDSLADEFMQRFRRGERPTVAEYIEQYPSLAEQIRDLFPALIMLESLAKDDEGPSSLLAGVKRPDVLGDYRILQEVGRGGMGIVYEAEQISLGRHVALKVLPFQFSHDEDAVERFLREARAAALLQHPNIVQVYDVGEEDSVWYYAMQFVHGQPLHEVLDELRCVLPRENDVQNQTTLVGDLAMFLLSDTVSMTGAGEQATFEMHDGRRACREDRELAVRGIVDEFLRGRQRGEGITEQQLLEQHEELLPELEFELRMVRLLEASRPPRMVEDLATLQASRETECPRQRDGGHGALVSHAPPSTAAALSGHPNSSTYSRRQEYYQNVARLTIQVAQALEYAHQNGVIHRDVKPSNLILDTRGRVMVTDFGLAKLSQVESTTTGRFVGTLRYMSPEQIKGRSDRASDVYSLGITLYEMLTLRPAFPGPNYLDTIHDICDVGPPPPREVERAIPRDLETIVLKATARDASQRYATSQSLADDLQRFLHGEPISARRTGGTERVWRYCRRNAGVTALVAALALAAALGWLAFAWTWVQWQRDTMANESAAVTAVDVPVPSTSLERAEGLFGSKRSHANPPGIALPARTSRPSRRTRRTTLVEILDVGDVISLSLWESRASGEERVCSISKGIKQFQPRLPSPLVPRDPPGGRVKWRLTGNVTCVARRARRAGDVAVAGAAPSVIGRTTIRTDTVIFASGVPPCPV